MWIGVQHQQKEALEIFSREVAPAGTGMAPGQTTLIGGRPNVYSSFYTISIDLTFDLQIASPPSVFLPLSQGECASHCHSGWGAHEHTDLPSHLSS